MSLMCPLVYDQPEKRGHSVSFQMGTLLLLPSLHIEDIKIEVIIVL